MRTPCLQTVIHWLAIASVLCFALQVFSDNKADVDLWGNIGFVRARPGRSGFHTTNTYSYTEPDRPWVNHEWLAQYIMHGTWHLAGNVGLLLLKVLLGLTVLALMHASLRRECRSGILRWLILVLIISTMSYGFSTRPHHFTYLFLALFFTILKRFATRSWAHLVVLPLLGLLWANLHGAFFIGAIVLVFHALVVSWRCWRRTVAVPAALIVWGGVVLFGAASIVNPYGVRLWGFIFESGAAMRPYLSEWAPFSPLEHGKEHPDFVALALVACCAFPFSKARKEVLWTALLYVSLLSAILLRRNIPLFAITAAFALGPHIASMAGEHVERITQRLPRRLLVLALALLIPASLYKAATFNKKDPFTIEIPAARYPLRTVEFIKTHGLTGNMLVFFDWAEYCIWHLYPDCRVFLDGRFLSAYSTRVVRDYLAALYGQAGGERALDDYDTDMVLVHYGNPIAGQMARRHDWKLIHADGPAMLFVRRSDYPEALSALRQGQLPNVNTPAAVFP